MCRLLIRPQASFSAEEAAHGEVKSEDDTLKPLQQLEALVKDYKATVAKLETELKEARAHPVITEDPEAKKTLLAEVEKERAAKEEAVKGGWVCYDVPRRILMT